MMRPVDDINSSQREPAAQSLPDCGDFAEERDRQQRGDDRLQDHGWRNDGRRQVTERIRERHVSDKLRDDCGCEKDKPTLRAVAGQRITECEVDEE